MRNLALHAQRLCTVVILDVLEAERMDIDSITKVDC